MSEAISGLSRSASGYMIERAQSPSNIVIRPVPEGFRTWLPALFVLVGTPFIALVIAKSGIISPQKSAFAAPTAYAAKAGNEHGSTPISFVRFPLADMGQVGVHTGFKDLALVGGSDEFRGKVEQNKAKILALASVDLADTSVSDMDKPGALDEKRAQLLADFNQALGGSVIEDVYLSEWPPEKR